MSASSLKAIVVKELRENLQWAMLACVIAMGILSFYIYSALGAGESIAGHQFLRIYGFICPAAGLVIGLMQMLPEMRRGRWQFVTHRPVSRPALLLGKILVGIALYFLAVGMPMALISVWVATPGHVPGPFAWNMLYQPLSDLYSGFAWYAAGLLVGCRRGRWFGTRLIPIGAAATIYFPWYFEPVATPIVIVLLLAAAWGAFMAAGEMAQSRWWARASLAILLIAGWTVVIGIGTAFAQAVVTGDLLRATSNEQLSGFESREGIEFMTNVWLHTWKIDGKLVLNIDDRASLNFQDPARDSHEVQRSATLTDQWPDVDVRPHKLLLVPIFSPGSVNWFFVGERHTIEGYDRRTNRYIGSISLLGFAGPNVPPQALPETAEGRPWRRSGSMGIDSLLVLADLVYPDAVYHLHYSPPGIQKVFSAAPGDAVIFASMMIGSDLLESLETADAYIAVETRNRVHIIRGDKELMSGPLDGRSPHGSIAVAILKSGRTVVAYPSQDPFSKNFRKIVHVYNPDGTLVNHWSFDEDPMAEFQRGPQIDWLGICGFTGFSPLPLVLRVQSLQHSGEAAPLVIMNIVTLALFAAGVSVTIAMSILRSRHATRPQVYLWIIVCAAFGVVGILTMAAILNRLPRLRCATCGRRMLPTEPTCVHCHSPAAPPPMRGIEILAPGMVLA
jgi:hypothetical protein